MFAQVHWLVIFVSSLCWLQSRSSSTCTAQTYRGMFRRMAHTWDPMIHVNLTSVDECTEALFWYSLVLIWKLVNDKKVSSGAANRLLWSIIADRNCAITVSNLPTNVSRFNWRGEKPWMKVVWSWMRETGSKLNSFMNVNSKAQICSSLLWS